MANIRPNIRQHPLLSRYPGSEYSVGYSPDMLASACAHGESSWSDYVCWIRIEENVQHWGHFSKSYAWHHLVKVERWGVGKCCSILLCWDIPGEIFPEMWTLDGKYRIVVVGFCFLVGVIINLICLWEVVICMIDWINLNIPYLCFAYSYWWACRWSSGPCGGNKWRLYWLFRELVGVLNLGTLSPLSRSCVFGAGCWNILERYCLRCS